MICGREESEHYTKRAVWRRRAIWRVSSSDSEYTHAINDDQRQAQSRWASSQGSCAVRRGGSHGKRDVRWATGASTRTSGHRCP